MTSIDAVGGPEGESIPSIDDRILAAFPNYDPTFILQQVELARGGSLGRIYGIAEQFNGVYDQSPNRDRLDRYFSATGLTSAWYVGEHVTGQIRGPAVTVSARALNRGNEDARQKFNNLLATHGMVSVEGPLYEIEGGLGEQPLVGERYRQLWWSQVSDDYGRLPVFRRTTGPATELRSRRDSVWLKDDWVILRGLQVPEVVARTAEPEPAVE